MGLRHRIRARYATRNDQIVAQLREASGAAAPLDLKTVVRRKSAELSTAMALLHGGDWRVQIEHDEGFVLVSRRNRRRSP